MIQSECYDIMLAVDDWRYSYVRYTIITSIYDNNIVKCVLDGLLNNVY